MSLISRFIKRNFLAGLIITIPFGLTAFILYKLSKWIVGILSAAPANFITPLAQLPKPWFDITTFAIGFSATIIIVLLLGLIARNYIGGKLIGLGESIINRIPFARTIYTATKQIIETIFLESGIKGFKRVIVFEFPRRGIYSLGFVTGSAVLSRFTQEPDKKMLSVFLPTSPNPTSGYYMMVPEEDVRDLPITIEEAFRIIMSLGLASDKIGNFQQGKENDPDPWTAPRG